MAAETAVGTTANQLSQLSQLRRRVTPVRGREEELRLVGTLVDQVRSGVGGVAVVQGGAGSGRSRLLVEARRLATGAGLRALSGAADAESQLMPLAPLLDAMTRSGEPLLEPELMQRLRSGSDQRFWLLQEIQDRLEQAARRTPVLITIDDLHWADDATQLALRELPERLAGHPIGWVLAAPDARTADAATDRTLSRLASAGATFLPLPPLGPEAVEAVSRDVLGSEPVADDRALIDRAGGEPLLLLELLWSMAAGEGAGGAAPGVGAVISRRLQRLSEPAQEALRVGAVVGHRFNVPQLVGLLGQSQGALLAPMAELVSDDLVTTDGDSFVFRQELVREALTAELPVDLVRALRRQAVDADLAAGRPVLEVVDDLLSSALPGDAAAVQLLHRAADELAASDPGRGAELMDRVLELAPADFPGRGGLIETAVRLLVLTGRPSQGLALAERSLQGRLEPETEARVRLAIAAVHAEYSSTESLRHSSAALRLPGLPAGLRTRLLTVESLLRLQDYDVEGAAELVPGALRLAVETGDTGSRSALLAAEAGIRVHTEGVTAARDLVATATELVADHDPAELLWSPSFARAVLAGMAGRPEEAAAHVDAGLGSGPLSSALRARFRFDAGDLAGARRLVARFWEQRESLGPDHLAAVVIRYTAGRVALAAGDEVGLANAARDVRRMLEESSAAVRCTGGWLAALIADARGDSAQALALATPALTRLETPGPWLSGPSDPADTALMARIAVRAGDETVARRVLARAAREAAANPDVPAFVAAEAHTRGLVERNPAPIREAVSLLENGERPLALGAALEDAGRLARSTDEAVGHYDRVLGILDGRGAHRDAARVRAQMRDLGVRRRRVSRSGGVSGWEALTAAELQVVRLLARGGTKQAAAEQLFLSPHTVSSHLRSAYRKLGVRSRVELVRIVLDQDQ